METHNIVSTPNITGNIGSCKTESASVESGRNLFVLYKTNITTNSCTGEVNSYQTWELSDIPFLGFLIIVAIALVYWGWKI